MKRNTKSALSHNLAFSLIEVSVWLFITLFLVTLLFQASLFYVTTAHRVTKNTQVLVEIHSAMQLMHNDFAQAPIRISDFVLGDTHVCSFKNNAGRTISWRFSPTKKQLTREYRYQTADGKTHSDSNVILEMLNNCTFSPVLSGQLIHEMIITLTKAPHTIQRCFFIGQGSS